jgi:NTE family protein
MALHAVSLLTQRRLIDDIDRYRGEAKLIVLPPPCPLAIPPIDFDHADNVIQRSYSDAQDFLEGGGAQHPPIRMRMHRHTSFGPKAKEPVAAK